MTEQLYTARGVQGMGRGNKYADHFPSGSATDLRNYFQFEDAGYHLYGQRNY